MLVEYSRNEKAGKFFWDLTVKKDVPPVQTAFNSNGNAACLLSSFPSFCLNYLLKVFVFISILLFVVFVFVGVFTFAPNYIPDRFSELSVIKTINFRCGNSIAKY